MASKEENLRKLNIRKLQPKGGINLYSTPTRGGETSMFGGDDFLNKVFSENAYPNKSLPQRINAIYQFTDRYTDELEGLMQAGTSPATGALKDQAMRNAQASLSAQKRKFAIPLNDFSHVIENNEFFNQTRGFWNEVTESVELFEPKKPSLSERKRQNIFVRNVAKDLSNALSRGDIEAEYGNRQAKRFRSPISSQKGEMTYFNLESKEVFANKFYQDVFGGSGGKNYSSIQQNLDSYFNSIGGTLDETTINELKNKVSQEIRGPFSSEGLPDIGYAHNLTDETRDRLIDISYKAAQGDDANIISSQPGKVLYSHLSDGTSQNHRYANNLSSSNSRFFKKVLKNNEKNAKRQVNSASIQSVFDAQNLSNDVVERLNKTNRSISEMDNQIRNTREVFGWNKKSRKNVIKKTNHEERIQEAIGVYQEKGFNVSIDYSQDSDNLLFHFAKRGDGPDLTGMSLTEKMANENIGRIILPLESDDYLTNIQGIKVQSSLFLESDVGFDLKNRKANTLKMRRTSDVAYDEIIALPAFMERTAEARKDVSQSELFDIGTSRYQNIMTSKLNAGQFPGMDRSEGYKTGSKTKNLLASSIVDVGDFVEEYYKTEFPESYKRFEDYRAAEGNPGLRFIDNHNFRDYEWVNPRSGKKESMNMKTHMLTESVSRFNEMYGSEQEGLQLTPYGLNANQAFSGNLMIGDWRQTTPLGELNPATREQILKTPNYAAMERDIMDNYLRDFYGEEAGARYSQFISRKGKEGLHDAMAESNELSQAYGRVFSGSDRDFAEANKAIGDNVQKEIGELNAKINVTSDSELRNLLEAQKAELESELHFYRTGRASVFEEQILVRESWARSTINRQESYTYLDEGYELPENLRTKLRKDNIELFDEAGNLRPGTHEVNLTHKDLEDMGLVDRKNKITVGTLTKEYAESRGANLDKEVAHQTQLFYKDSKIQSIFVEPDGSVGFTIDQVRRMDDGGKYIGSTSGVRSSSTIVPDRVYDRYDDYFSGGDPRKRTLFMREHTNEGRKPAGGLINELITTSHLNAMEDLDDVLVRSADGSYRINADNAQTKAVREWAENAGTFSTKEEFQRDFIENRFIKDIDETGLTGMVILNKRTDDGRPSGNALIQINETSKIGILKDDSLSNQEYKNSLKSAFDSLTDISQERYGADPGYHVGGLSMHDIPRWQGQKGPRYADRESRMLSIITGRHLGSDSALSGQIRNMTGGPWAEQHRDFALHLRDSLEVFQDVNQDIRQYQRGGNVVFDYSGNFSGDTSVLREIAEDGSEYFRVDGYAIPEGTRGMATGSEVRGTTRDLMTVNFNDLGLDDFSKEYTVQDMVRDNKGQAVIQMPEGYSKGVLPVYGHLGEDYEQRSTLFQRRMNKGQSEVTSALLAMRNPETLSENELSRYRRAIESGTDEMYQGASSYFTGKGKSDFIKSQTELDSRRGMSGVLGGYNIESTFLREDEFGVSPEMARHLIEGNEDNILKANNVTILDGTAPADLTPEEIQKEKQDYIIRQITGKSDTESDFAFMSSYNRYPTQSQGSIQFGKVRVDEGLEGTDRLMIGRYVADASGADFDGDTGYLLADYYTEYGENTDFQKIQGNMLTMSKVSQEMIQDMEKARQSGDLDAFYKARGLDLNDSGFKETFSYIREGQPGDDAIYDIFGRFTGDTAEALDFTAKATQVPGIGYIDNELVAGRTLVQETYENLHKEGHISASEMNQYISQYDEGSDNLVQGYISAKKLEPEMLDVYGPEGDLLETFESMEMPQQLARLQEVTGERSILPGSISGMNTSNIDEVIQTWVDASALDKEDVGAMRQFMEPLAAANEANAFRAGAKNSTLRLGRGQGTDIAEAMYNFKEKPETLMDTPEIRMIGETFFSEDPQIIENFNQAQKESTARASQNWLNIRDKQMGRASVASTSDIASSLVDSLDYASGMVEQNLSERRVMSQNQTFNQIKGFAKKTANSNAFKVGAGAAAMWMLSSSLRSGPAPEGNDAEQEASEAEVNPSALLTNPTARVTPNAQATNLSISGTGNLDEAAVAGLVNNELNHMMGTSMSMNVNVTDNTRRLDRKFYENQVNSVLGV